MSQGRVPLSEPKVRKILDTTERMLDAFERVGWGALLIGAEGRVITTYLKIADCCRSDINVE